MARRFSERSVERVIRSVRRTEAMPTQTLGKRGIPRKRTIAEWQGRIVAEGASGEADFSDHRYWVHPVTFMPDTADGDPTDKAVVFKEYSEGADEWYRAPRVVTNVGEDQTRGHLLWLDDVVTVKTVVDPFGVARSWMNVSPRQPWIWVKITNATPDGANRWLYDGIRQVKLPSGLFVNAEGYFARVVTGIRNPVENYNDGTGNEGNSINVDNLDACEILPVRGDPVVPIAPTVVELSDDNVAVVKWDILDYPNSVQEE